MKELFDNVSIRSSRMVTRAYSTSFSLGISCLDKELRDPICAIYGFVRFADEIVDTFHDFNKAELLERFKGETHLAIKEGISLNPILNSFQHAVNDYNINLELIDQFLYSMEMDLTKVEHSQSSYEEYILGSAEVVGLMCLKVFCYGDQAEYDKLRPYAMKLGSAFQKINFLRDLNDDFLEMGRTYFPGVSLVHFDEVEKKEIEKDIEQDFQQGLEGIKKLPKSSRFGVYLAYVYYYALFKKIKNTHASRVLHKRIRIPNPRKFSLLFYTYLRHRLNII
ncbi:phytoene/squalene synthase family protein [Fulvivirga lutea]|uniref:Phytoene/squalene synthase family protein n=1 Tax=Fulvivirga lutea TaxID=2810512 RepID=A0A974WDS9_9BACT|nr:phytoene/squalene synthase family protein [Fulvivirga lutea]QSE96046.1 phytoene/squalene synthase family protein [Fulvivirga lutea]